MWSRRITLIETLRSDNELCFSYTNFTLTTKSIYSQDTVSERTITIYDVKFVVRFRRTFFVVAA